jgi:shikimate dehydrogenase
MKIDGKTKSYGLIGNPVEHSISPTIHNFLAERMNQNILYSTNHVENDRLEFAVKGAHALNIKGLNVTVPYKTEVMKYVSSVEEDAKIIGAVNTLDYTENGYHARNTDYEGLYRALQSDGIELEQEHVIILGAGGAARATLYMCMKYSRNPIYILNRSEKKAEELAGEMNEFFGRKQVKALSLDSYGKIPDIKRGYLTIQTTSVGLYPNVDDLLIDDDSFYKKIRIGYDIIYNPEKTAFMKRVEMFGGKSYNGLKMLLYQAILAFETWCNVKVSKELCEDVLQKMKEDLNGK